MTKPVWTLQQARVLDHCRICGHPRHWLGGCIATDTEYAHEACIKASKPKTNDLHQPSSDPLYLAGLRAGRSSERERLRKRVEEVVVNYSAIVREFAEELLKEPTDE